MNSELLLPVGNLTMCLAAIHHGADAVYFGVPFFNARGRTTDFSLNELREMIDLCHLYGVKTYLAFNVVIFEQEISKIIDLLKELIPMGPDAFIVQDLGLAKIIREMAPFQRIHASTQMTVTNADAIKFLEDLKIDRFVLGRENSISEMKMIREQTDKELEVFVHGALCVAYSGQCFTSESIGGRSANRGQCAQSCRLEYELYADDKKIDLGDKKYLVSPKDLMGIEHVQELEQLGINSFKVEGRLKTPEYVASAARNYREVLDGENLNLKRRTLELSSTYSRGFFSGWLKGVDHQQLVDGTYSAHRGLKVGAVKEIRKNTLLIESSVELKPGAGLLFVNKNQELGGKIFEANKKGNLYEVELLKGSKDVKVKSDVYLNSNEALERELQKGWMSRDFQKRIPLKFLVQGKPGELMQLTLTDPEGRSITVNSHEFMQLADQRPLDEKILRDELGALSGTCYSMESFLLEMSENCFLNHRSLKELRRTAVEEMNRLRTNPISHRLGSFEVGPRKKTTKTTKMNILLRAKDQVDGIVLAFRQGRFLDKEHLIDSIVLDFEFGKDYASSVELLRATPFKIGIATTRILKPQEYHNLKMIIRLNPDFFLVRNLGAIEFIKNNSDLPMMGDFSLNVTNSISAEYLLSKGFSSVTASYDLNQRQLMDLIEHMDPAKLEVTLHQYMPEFHMEHCVFAAFLSKGSSFRDCGKPCEKHQVKLKDPYGQWHYLKADHECRNTFFKATPQSASFMIEDLKKNGVGFLRLEALDERPDELVSKIDTYLDVLSGKTNHQQAIEKLGMFESYGVNAGQLSKNDNYQDRKKSTLP